MIRAIGATLVVLVAAVLITVLASLMPDPAAERCEIPGHARTALVECE